MRSDIRMVLGVVVAGVLGSACGGRADGIPGGLTPDGRTTGNPTRVEKQGSCYTTEEWRFVATESISCDAAFGIFVGGTTKCVDLCGDATASCTFADDKDQRVLVYQDSSSGKVVCKGNPVALVCEKMLESHGCPIEGRRPAGLHAALGRSFASVASYFAHAAHLEAAAVLAFERLEVELRAFGAPDALCARLRRAASEERRHVEITSSLARRFGAEPIAATADAQEPRSLFDIAKENVVEGVVRETYGAATALYRADRAAHSDVRASLGEIAVDECRHAQLSWDLHAWLVTQLDDNELAALEEARRDAIAELRVAVLAEPGAELEAVAGVPSARDAIALVDRLSSIAWA